MEVFLQHIPAILALLVLLIIVLSIVYMFFTLPTESQTEALIEFLKLAVIEAEKELGSGTGQIKLIRVYEMSIGRFPWLMRKISFEQFSIMVDVALEWMREQIKNNENIRYYVE